MTLMVIRGTTNSIGFSGILNGWTGFDLMHWLSMDRIAVFLYHPTMHPAPSILYSAVIHLHLWLPLTVVWRSCWWWWFRDGDTWIIIVCGRWRPDGLFVRNKKIEKLPANPFLLLILVENPFYILLGSLPFLLLLPFCPYWMIPRILLDDGLNHHPIPPTLLTRSSVCGGHIAFWNLLMHSPSSFVPWHKRWHNPLPYLCWIIILDGWNPFYRLSSRDSDHHHSSSRVEISFT